MSQSRRLGAIANSKKCRLAKRLPCARVEPPVLSVGETPGLCRGLLLTRQDPAYRLTSTLVPPAPGPLMRAPSPLETTLS
jgi:hypothetical protein